MAVDLAISYPNNHRLPPMEQAIATEAAAGLHSVENFVKLLSNPIDTDLNCRAVANDAVFRFKKVISMLGRSPTGHARFRRAPPPIVDRNAVVFYPKPIRVPTTVVVKERVKEVNVPTVTIDFSISSGNLKSTVTCEEERQKSSLTTTSFQMTNYSGSMSSVKPPLSHTSSSLKVRKSFSETGKCGGPSGRCHCCKKSKMKVKRVERVPAISTKMADIPVDEYSWRKYGQKPIKGSPHPRGYYRCSTVRNCPARKHVERALDDPSTLIVTYDGEHDHSISIAETSNDFILESS